MSLINELEQLGLSERQAEMYIVLLQHGELRIQEIANKLNIPRSSVYEHLKSLAELGLVEKIIDHKFVRIRPYPVTVLRHQLEERMYLLQEQKKELLKVEKALAQLPNPQFLPNTTIRYYKGISGARQLFWNTLKAKDKAFVYSEYGRQEYLGKKFYTEFVRESVDRKIKEQVLINPTDRVINLLDKYLDSPLARTPAEVMHTLDVSQINIKGETFIYDNIFAQVYINNGEINGFEIENRQFTLTQRTIFQTLVQNAQHLPTLLENRGIR